MNLYDYIVSYNIVSLYKSNAYYDKILLTCSLSMHINYNTRVRIMVYDTIWNIVFNEVLLISV